jgi:hypothetical protein
MTIIYSSKKLKQREPYDHYPTPLCVCRAAINVLPEDFYPGDVLDPGAGNGVWGKAISEKYPRALLCGVELRNISPDYDCYDVYQSSTDFLDIRGLMNFDLIVGNPPYKHAEEFIQKSYDLLYPDGYLLFLLRLSFLEGNKRYNNFYTSELKPKEVWVSVRRVSFTQDRKSDNTAYGIYLWQKGYTGDTKLNWLNWEYE